MRVIAMTDFDSGVSLGELPTPEPTSNELLVRVQASSVNGMDVGIVGGLLRGWMEYDFPVVLGRDFAGVVEGVGADTSRYRLGDEVIGFVFKPVLHDGTWADYVLTPQDGYLASKPASLDFGQAAALPLAGSAALLAVDAVEPSEGASLLVVGAGGGVGSYAVQLAATRGAHVIATARPGDEQRLRALGAAETIDFTTNDVAAMVRERHPNGVHALIDTASQADAFAGLAEVVRGDGRVASTLGAADIEKLAARSVTATNVGAASDPGAVARVAELADTGQLIVPVDSVLPMTQAPAAIEQFAAGKRGKIIIAVTER